MPNAIAGRPIGAAQELDAFRRRLMQGVPNVGTIGPHLKELQDLVPERASLEMLSFPALVTATGVITQPDTQSLPANYWAELFEIRGYMQDALAKPDLLPKVEFNIQDRERAASGSLWGTNIEMGHLVGSNGQPVALDFPRGLYVFQPGARISVVYSIDTDGTTGYVAQTPGGTLEYGVLLRFNLYSK